MDLSRVYIDLESIFDTRLATLGVIYPQVATDLLKRDDYWFRESDHWHKLTGGKIGEAEFQERFAKRDNATLHASVMTNIFAPLIKMISENEIAMNDGRPNREMAIDVNIWPYTFDDIEMEAFIDFFVYRLGFKPRITFMSRPPEAVTPKFLTDTYALGFMYLFNDWIKIHLKNLVLNRTQGFNLIVPRLFEHDASRLSIEDKQDEVTKFRLYLMEYMNIHFIDASCFSVFRPV
jgi:hypothetical protein